MFTAAHQQEIRANFILTPKNCILLKINWIMVTYQTTQKDTEQNKPTNQTKPKTHTDTKQNNTHTQKNPTQNPQNPPTEHLPYTTAYWQLHVMDVWSIRRISGMEKTENIRTLT